MNFYFFKKKEIILLRLIIAIAWIILNYIYLLVFRQSSM